MDYLPEATNDFQVIISGPIITWGLLGLLALGILIAIVLLLMRKRISNKALCVGLIISVVMLLIGLLGLLLV